MIESDAGVAILRRLPGWIGTFVLSGLLVLLILSDAGLGGVEWGAPRAIWLLIPVFLLVFQRDLTGANRLAVPRMAKRRWSIRGLIAWIPDVLRIAGLALVVVALARPRITHRDQIVESDGLDILLAIDTSGSMRQEDMATSRGYASRIEVAKGVAGEFVGGRPYDRIGVVVFGEEAFTFVPLTLDHDTLADALDTVDIGMAGSRGTAVGTAIAVSSKRIMEVPAPSKIVILVTDGRSNAGRLAPKEAAQAAAALGIRVYTIGVGAAGGLGGFVSDGVDEPMMREVARLTGGQYFRATDLRSLEAVYDKIDELETTPAKVKELVEHEELFRRPLIPAVILLGFSTLLSTTLLRRGP